MTNKPYADTRGNWVADMYNMHAFYGVHEAVDRLDPEKLKTLLQFRIDFLKEELNELQTAETPEDVVDALIDLCVVAIGTLDLFKVDAQKAWEQVYRANLDKEVGVKPTRPNPLHLPDLIKNKDWVGPNHMDNHGTLITFMD